MGMGVLHRVGLLAGAGVIVASSAVLWPGVAHAGTAAQAGPQHRAWTRDAGVASHAAPATTARHAGHETIDERLQALGVDPSRAIVERGLRNYVGPRCPGRGWSCTSSARPVVQIAGNGGANHAVCPRRGPCVVVQVASGTAGNTVDCVHRTGAAQSCTISQTSISGHNRAHVIEWVIRTGLAQSVSQAITITQVSTSGENTANVLQATRLFATSATSGAVAESVDAHQTIAITQDSQSGSNVVQGPVWRSALVQDQLVVERATSAAGVTQSADGETAGPNLSLDIQQNEATANATGTNYSSFRQMGLLRTTAVTRSGPVAQDESTTAGGLYATLDQFSTGLSRSYAAQSETQYEAASTTPGGATLPSGTIQTQVGPVRCCSQQASNPSDAFGVTQRSTQCAGTAALTCTEGDNADSDQLNTITGACQTSGNCTVGQTAVVDGMTTTATKSGSSVSSTTSCVGSVCNGGSTPVASIGAVCVNGLTIALNGAVDWKGAVPGSVAIDWGDGVLDRSSSMPSAHRYATAGSYTVKVTAAGAGAPGSASTTVTVGSKVSTCSYTFVPVAPIAASSSLAFGQSVTFAVEVDQRGEPLSGAPVWLGFATWSDGPHGGATAGGSATALSGTAQVFVTGAGGASPGQVDITYTAPSSSSKGRDVVTAAEAPDPWTSGVVRKDGYTYGCDTDACDN